MDSSDYESDAGASPSVSDSEDTSGSESSRCSSPGALKIVCQPLHTPRKKATANLNNSSNNFHSQGSTPSVRLSRKKNGTSPNTKSGSKKPKIQTVTPLKIRKLDVKPPPRKRKRVDSIPNMSKKPNQPVASTSRNSCVGNVGIKMNQRRRTKSERNNRAGKPVVPPEEAVVLDAEIDKFLEAKALKNNLTATNVKSIIRHVITNNMVQKMVMTTVKQKTGNPDESSDEEADFEPKLTRARTKLLLEKEAPPLWHIVSSPAKGMKKPIMSETHALIHEELPEDSSGDEEYLPKEAEDETHSDDENSSVASSHASDVGSPRVSTPGSSTRSREGSNRCGGTPTDKTSLFKTPPPLKPKCVRRIGSQLTDSAIGRRTRSKLPLNDTALEDLEKQLIPPDITPDMYDWGLSDNEDYLAFVKEFLCPGQNNTCIEGGDDEEGDPEYNVMEDEEEHDKEELRMDRAVKVTKKELNELVAELLEEAHFTSGDDMDETDYGIFSVQPSETRSSELVETDGQHSLIESISQTTPLKAIQEDESPKPKASTSKQNFKTQSGPLPGILIPEMRSKTVDLVTGGEKPVLPEVKCPILETIQIADIRESNTFDAIPENRELEPEHHGETSPPESKSSCLFSADAISIMQHQMRQHVQLLAQSYVLTASIEHAYFKDIAKASKRMIVELQNFTIAKGKDTHFSAANLNPAWQVVNSWPHTSSTRTPIKKKILEEKYINDYKTSRIADHSSNSFRVAPFPRHVAKVIAESPAFCYPELLPVFYNQNVQTKSSFTPSEDVLLIYGLEDLKDYDAKAVQKCRMISQVLLPAKSPQVTYQRLRNLRKSHCTAAHIAKLYFKTGEIPKGAEVPSYETFTLIPPISHPKEKLPPFWRCMIDKLCHLSELNWNSKCDIELESLTKSGYRRKYKINPISNNYTVSEQPKKDCFITSTFPPGMEMLQKQISKNPDLVAVPLMMMNGDPGAYLFIPQYAMPATGYNNSPIGTEASQSRYYHPVPFYEPKANLLSPESSKDDSKTTISFTPVGKPFSLDGMDKDFINLATLDTPLKNAILEHVHEATPKKDNDYSRSEEHSARTAGNYIRGSVNNSKDNPDERFDSYDSESTGGGLMEEDDDVNLTEYEETCDAECPESPVRVLETLEIHDDSDNEEKVSDLSSNLELQDAGESGQTKNSNVQEKENSSSGFKTKNASRSEESLSRNTSQRVNKKGDEDDEDEEDGKVPRPKRSLPEDAADDVDRDEDTEEELEIPHCSKNKSTSHLSNHNRISKGNPKKLKRSPGIVAPKKRTPKTTPVEKMLEEDKHLDEEVCDAFMQSFLLKVQSVTECRHPGLHSEFFKLLSEVDEKEPQVDVLSKVQTLLKDYPELVGEFAAFVNLDTDKSVPVNDTNFTETLEMDAQINFIRHLEKFTESSPQLKAKILHKFKVLKEEPDLSQKDLADALAPFFQGNVVMMDAFKALLPSIYRPELMLEADFEEVDMEADDTTGQEDPNSEFVKLPEEKHVPATNTCSCQCHDTGTHAYSSRVKHCNKCCIKDGKVFVHNGRVIRPVNVELKSPTSAKKILSGKSCRTCIQEPNNKTKEGPVARSQDESVLAKIKSDDIEISATIAREDDIEEGEIIEDDRKQNDVPKQNLTQPSQTAVVQKPSADNPSETKVTLRPWTIEEDRILITTCNLELTVEEAFEKVATVLKTRDITEIESRCVELLSLLKQSQSTSINDNEAAP